MRSFDLKKPMSPDGIEESSSSSALISRKTHVLSEVSPTGRLTPY
jgi:hypothetical protein